MSDTAPPAPPPDLAAWLRVEPSRAAAGEARDAAGAAVVRWDGEGCTVTSAGGPSRHIPATDVTLQVSRAAVARPAGRIARLLGLESAPVPHLRVDLRTARERLCLHAPASDAQLADLPHLQGRAAHTLALSELCGLVDALRSGGARLARGGLAGASAAGAAEGPIVRYQGRRHVRALSMIPVTATLLGVAGYGLADAGVDWPWLVAALAAPLLWGGFAEARWVRDRPEASGARAAIATWLVRGGLVASLAASGAFVYVATGPGAWWGALALVSAPFLLVALRRWRTARRSWTAARLDTKGLHATRATWPREEHIGWDAPTALRIAALREGTRLLDVTTLTHDALRLSTASHDERCTLLARRAAGEPLGPLFPPGTEDEALYYVRSAPDSPQLVGAIVAFFIVGGPLVAIMATIVAVRGGVPFFDPRVGTIGLLLVVFWWRVTRHQLSRVLDRHHQLDVEQQRFVPGDVPLYTADRDTLLRGRPLPRTWVASESSQARDRSWRVQGVGGDLTLTFPPGDAEKKARAHAAALETWLEGGPLPPPYNTSSDTTS